MIGRVLERTVVTVQARGEIYKAVDQSVLLYGSESWVEIRHILRVLTTFHHRSKRRVTGEFSKTWVRQRVGVSIGRGGDGIHGDLPRRSIHKEAADDHIGEGGLPDCLCVLHRGGADARDKLDSALVGSRGGK